MYRAGIIGCGWIGVGYSNQTKGIKSDNHLQAYLDCPEVEVIAVCDKSPGKLFQKYLEYRKYSEYKDMVREEKLDIISVCTPPETHCQIVCDIAPYVKAILCEKPIALTLADADRMVAACYNHGTILQINHQRAFITPKFRFSRDIIDTGTHMFELLARLFGKATLQDGDYWFFGDTWVEIEYVDTSALPWEESHVFELDVTHNSKPMLLASVEALVSSLKTGEPSKCSGEAGREALRLALLFKGGM